MKIKYRMNMNGEAKFVGLLMVGLVMASKAYCQELEVGFYRQSCPLAESIVRDTVAKAVLQNPGMAAGLIRMHFHDCIVLGCDASILLDKTPQDPSEKDAPGNPLLRGFEIIDDAKAQLEAQCPQTVSCADIMAFAARDSVATVGQFTYAVPGGRRDSLVSHAADVFKNVPFPTSDIGLLKQHFEERGLSLRDMVALSGAHSIGRTACAEFSDRLFNFNGSTGSFDPTLDPKFAAFLREKCPMGSGFEKTADLDNVTPNRLDVQFFENLKNKMGVLASDQALVSDPLTAATVKRYQSNRAVWMMDFAKAMVKMGKLQVLTGTQGEIRKNCHFTN